MAQFIIALVLLWLALYAFAFAVYSVFVAIPGALAGLFAGGTALLLKAIQWRKTQAQKFSELGLGVRLERSAGSIAWTAAPEEIDLAWPHSITIGAVGASLAVVLIMYFGIWDDLFGKPKGTEEEIIVWLSGIIAAGASTAGVVALGSWQARTAKARIAEELVSIVSWRMADATELLTKIMRAEEAIASELSELGVPVNGAASEAAMRRVRKAVGQSPQGAHRILQRDVAKLEADLSAIRTSGADWDNVQALFEEVKDAALCSGSRTLLREVDQIYEAFESGAIQSLFAERKWKDLDEVLAGARQQLNRLQALAMASGPSDDRSASTDGIPKSVDEAYATLNIPPTASDEVVKRAYRALAAAWHSDAGSQDDEMMKRMNVAYDLIRRDRGL